jgi:hypothetical protein
MKRVDIDSVFFCIIEESLLEVKRDKLNNLLIISIVISLSTINKFKDTENDVEDMRKEITSLKNQVQYYKGAWDASSNFY